MDEESLSSKGMGLPLVSVGIPVFNEEAHLGELLDSVLGQTYPRMEILLSDNASTDGSWAIARRRAASDSRLRITRQEVNRGAVENFAEVLRQARGRYFIWAGGHDRWAEDMIERCVAALEGAGDAVLAAPRTAWVDERGEVLRTDSRSIDTRGSASPAARALAMYRQMTRCSAFYGLFRAEELRKAWASLPRVIGLDFILLMRVAAMGDVVTPPGSLWYRRALRVERSRTETSRRQVEALGLTGAATWMPLLVSRAATLRLFAGLEGTPGERAALLSEGVRRFFDGPQRALLREELGAGLVAGLRSLRSWSGLYPGRWRWRRGLGHPVLVTSVPKSGTNLLMNMVSVLPGAHRGGDASLAAELHDPRERLAYIKWRLEGIEPGAFFTGHFPFHEEIARWMRDRGFRHLFIYRDPRDYCVSVCHYVMRDAPRRHAYYELFDGFGSDSERLMKVICGHGEGRERYRMGVDSVPNIRVHFEAYLGWLDREDTWAVRYEDLIAPDGGVAPTAPRKIREMLAFLGLPESEALVRRVISEGMAPARSRTFRKGGSGWRSELSERHLEAFKRVAGDLLEQLGYGW